MQLVKPYQAGLLFRTFDNDGTVYFCVTVTLLIDLDSGLPLPEPQLWQLGTEALDEDTIFDEGMFKPRGEFLVSGFAFPPEGAVVCQARAQVGPIDKSIIAIGDREWKADGPTEPRTFTKMPLTYRHAFGGEGFDKNPVGKGALPIEDADGRRRHPLPNLEQLGALITSPGQRPEPACFGPIDPLWHPRHGKLGTYDDAYMRTRFPGFAADFDWTYYNVAPRDQWLEAYWQGDEALVLENLHPERPRIEAKLPSLWGRCALRRKGEAELEDLPLQLDTVHLLPHGAAAALFFRGVTTVREDDADDIDLLLAACERKGEKRPLSHYERVAALRADPERGALHALRDGDLLPDGMVPATGELGGMDALLATSGAMQDNQRRGMEHTFEESRRRMVEAGFDTSALPPAVVPEREKPPKRHELADYMEKLDAEIDKQRAKADAQIQATNKQVRARMAEMNIDYDELVRDNDKGRPPKIDAEARYRTVVEQLELMKNAGVPAGELERQIEDGSLRAMLLRTEAEMLAAYRKFAHYFPEAGRLDGDAAARLRDEVERALSRSESLGGRDLTGADLSGLDLSGADLAGAFLASANLSGCNLSRANLSETVLARANLTGANLSQAILSGTNFGEATLDEADFGTEARLDRVIFASASLSGAKLRGAQLENADLMDATLIGCDLSEIRAKDSLFMGIDISGALLERSAIRQCTFLYAKAKGIDARGADWSGTTLMNVHLDDAKLDGAICTNLRVMGESSMQRCSLRGARADQANFERCDMSGADLTDAVLTQSVLSHSNLTAATLHRVDAVGALFMRACLLRAKLTDSNLRDALLGNADLRGCDLSGSLLFRADLSRVRVSGDTKVEQANIRYSTFIERREEAP